MKQNVIKLIEMLGELVLILYKQYEMLRIIAPQNTLNRFYTAFLQCIENVPVIKGGFCMFISNISK